MVASLLLALAITWLPMWFVLHRAVPHALPGRHCLVLGYSLVLGFIVVTLAMRLHSALGVPFSVTATGLSVLPLLLVGVFIRPGHYSAPVIAPGSPSAVGRVLLVACALLLTAHAAFVAIEVLNTPVFSWDSKQHWAKQARVFLEHGALVPHVGNPQWLLLGGEGVYTNRHPDYPVTLPLIQTWVGVAMGEWHDIYVNLPWLLCYGAIGLMFFGQLRVSGAGTVVSGAATYMVLSMPLLNAHFALAGYADPFMAAAFLGAFAAFLNWTQSRQAWQAALAVACATTCILLKQEGTYWAVAFLPGLMVLYTGARRGYAMIITAIAVVTILLLLLPKSTSFAGHTIREMHFFYRPQSWGPLFEGFFVHDNWHLLSYLCVGALVLALLFARDVLRPLAPAVTVLAGVVFLFLLLYLFSKYATAAAHHTSSNRLGMHFMPASLFLLAVLYSRVAGAVAREAETPPRD